MPSKNEIVLLRDQITQEVNRDAVVISNQLFGGPAAQREPDIQRVSDEHLQGLYRDKFMSQDRQWLQGEARRDPIQFTKVARAIGVVLPDELPGQMPLPNTLPLAAPAAPQMPMAPAAPAAPIDPQQALLALQQAQMAPQPVLPPPTAPPPGLMV